MQETAFGRMSIRLSSDMLARLKNYTKITGAPSDSAAVQFILLSFLNHSEQYPNTVANALCCPQDKRTSFSLSLQILEKLDQQAQQRRLSKAKCLRLVLYYSLYI